MVQSPKSKVQSPGAKSRLLRPWTLDLGPWTAAILSVLWVLWPAGALGASRPEAEQTKIDWLLKEVEGSGAVFIRNGKEYDAPRAVAHLKTKLLFSGRRVQTVRQFIVGVASHSEETGKPYEIRTSDGKRIPLQTWLLERLAVYEKGAKQEVPDRVK